MKRLRRIVLGVAVAALAITPVSPAQASHRCGLDELSHEVNVICENYHNPKPLLGYIFCLISPTC